MLFEMVSQALGDAAWIDSAEGGAQRTLFRREAPGSPWVVPWPHVATGRGGREGPGKVLDMASGEEREIPRRPGKAPKLRDLGPGRIAIHDGPHRLEIAYGGDGRWFESSCSTQDVFEEAVPLLAAGGAPAAEIAAGFAAGLDASRHGGGRVYLPVPVPGGPRAVWNVGMFALREALFRERIPGSARWAIADGWTGAALAFGATREAAITAWRAEVDRVRPAPERPAPPPELEDAPEPGMHTEARPGGFATWGTLRGPRSDVPWVEPAPERTPAALIPLVPLPSTAPPLGGWTRLLGARGETYPAALRFEKGGFTLVGDLLLERLDVARLEDQLATADLEALPRPQPPPDFPFPPPPTDTVFRVYRLVDDATHAPVKPGIASCWWGLGFHARGLDGDVLRWRAARLRPERK
jgi:hypothetical protein